MVEITTTTTIDDKVSTTTIVATTVTVHDASIVAIQTTWHQTVHNRENHSETTTDQTTVPTTLNLKAKRKAPLEPESVNLPIEVNDSTSHVIKPIKHLRFDFQHLKVSNNNNNKINTWS